MTSLGTYFVNILSADFICKMLTIEYIMWEKV